MKDYQRMWTQLKSHLGLAVVLHKKDKVSVEDILRMMLEIEQRNGGV